MPDNTPTLQSFYDTLASQGFTKKPYEEFATSMRDADRRRKLYDGLTSKGVDVAPSFEVFDQSMNGLLSQEKQQVSDWVTRERENVERQIAEATQSRDFSLADAMDGEVDGEAAGVRKKRDYTGGEVDENGKFTWTPMVSGEPVYENPVLTGITPGMAASSGNAQLADLDIAQRNLERAQETLTAPEKKDVSGIWGRIKAMGEGIGSLQTEDYLPIISGRSQAGDSDRMAEITNKINAGEPLSMTEQTLATAAGLKEKAASVSDLSSWYQGGEVIGAMAPYLGEMAMTSPVGSAVSGAVIGGTRLAQAGSLGMRILKGTSTLGISAGVQTPFMSMLPAAYSENRAGDYTVDENGVGRYVEGTQMGKGEAAYKALAQTYAEVFTEGLGEYGVKFMGVVAPGAKNAISKYIPDLLKKVSTKSGAMEFVQGFKKAAKFDGPFWEIGEEYANALMGSLLTADPSQLEYMFTQEGFTNVALPMFVMGAGFKAAEIPGRAVYRMNATSDLRKAERGMKEGTTPETYNAMVLAADAIKEGNIDKAQSILQGASDDMDVKSKAVALQYLRTRVNYDVMRGHIKEDYDSRLNSLQLGTDKMIQKIINKDGLIHQAVDKEGVLYYVLDKKAEEVSAENPAFALNAQTGEIEQVGAVPFDEISLYSIRDFEALMFDTATASLKQGMDAEEQIAEQTAQQAAQEEQIVANAEKSGIAPGTVVDYKGQQLTVSYVDNNGIHLEDQQQQPVVVPLSEQGKLKSVEAEAQPEETAPEQTGAVANAPAPQQEAQQPQSWTIGKKTFAMQQQEDGSTFIPFEAGKDETKTVAAEVDDTQFDVVPVTEEVPLQGVPAFAKKKTQTVVKGVRIVPKQTPNEQPITTGASVAPQSATAGAGTPATSEAASATSPAESNPEGTPLAGEVAEAQDGERKVVDLRNTTKRKKQLSQAQRWAANQEFTEPLLRVMQYFAAGNKIHPDVIKELFGTKGKENDPRVKGAINKERQARIGYVSNAGQTIDQIATSLWESQPEGAETTDMDYRDIVSDVVLQYNHPHRIATALYEMVTGTSFESGSTQQQANEKANEIQNNFGMDNEEAQRYAEYMERERQRFEALLEEEFQARMKDLEENNLIPTDEEYISLFLQEDNNTQEDGQGTDEGRPVEPDRQTGGADGIDTDGGVGENETGEGREEETPEPAQPTPAEQPLTEAEQRQQRRQSLTVQADEIDKDVTKKEAERAKLQKAYDEAKQRNQVSLLGNAGKPQAIEFDDQADVERETAQRIGAIEREIAANKQQSKALREQAEALNVDGKLGDQGSIKFDESFEEFVDRATNNEEPAQQPEAVQSETLLDAIVASDIEKQAAQADPNPSDAQKEAGNYKKGHTKVMGFDVTIENAAGSIRSGRDSDGEEWMVEMQNHYGYFTRTEGKDGDQVDCFIGENPETGKIFIVDQINPETGEFDEHKVMIGFDSLQEAAYDYNENYSYGWKGLGAITEMPLDEFKIWLKDGTRTKEPVAYGKESLSDAENTENQGEAQAENPAIEKQPTAEEFKPIRELGTGANVYFDQNGIRVNESIAGGYVLSVSTRMGDQYLTSVRFDNLKEAMYIADRLNKTYPNGVPSAVLIDNVIEGWMTEASAQPSNRSEKPTGSKQPWEMTREEYEYNPKMAAHGIQISHRFIVKQALSEGRPVPAEVLADYPELQKQSKAEQPEQSNDIGKAISASSRFRPYETIVFDNPIEGANGNKLVSYTWAYEWAEEWNENKGETVAKRVSDWNNAEESAETGRNIVHKFSIMMADGTIKQVSSESVLSMLGFVDNKQFSGYGSLVNSLKTLAKQKLQLAILNDRLATSEKVTEEINQTPKPEIVRRPYGDDRVEWVMGDAKVIDNARLYDEKTRTYTPNTTIGEERMYVLTKKWVKNRLEEKGLHPYKDNVSTIQSEINELKTKIERQQKKIDKLTESQNTSTPSEPQTLEDFVEGVENDDVRFRLESAEENNLVAVHNISESSILQAGKKGLIAPSIAIIKVGQQFTDFGGITLVGGRDMIDPETTDTKVFKGDVYSPTVPRPEFELNKKEHTAWVRQVMSKTYDLYRDIASKIENVVDDFGKFGKALVRYDAETIFKEVYDDMKAVYLIEKGIAFKIPKVKKPLYLFNNLEVSMTEQEQKEAREIIDRYNKETEDSSSDLTDKTRDDFTEFARKLVTRRLTEKYSKSELPESRRSEMINDGVAAYMGRFNTGMASYKIGKYLWGETEVNQEALKKVIDAKFKSKQTREDYEAWLREKTYQLQGRKYFTKGNQKISYTSDNLLDAMTNRIRGVEKGMTFGMNRAKSFAIKQLKNIDQIRKAQDKIISKEELTAIEKQMQDQYFDLANSIRYKYSDQWGKMDDFGKSLADYYKGASPASALSRNGFSPSKSDIEAFKEFADELASSPIDYLEAKTQRMVSLSEFSHAIVPQSTSKEVVQKLKDAGVKVVKYNDKENARENRAEALNKIASKKDVRFRIQDTQNDESWADTVMEQNSDVAGDGVDIFERHQDSETLSPDYSSYHFVYEPGLREIYEDPTAYDEVDKLYKEQGYLPEGYLPNNYDQEAFKLKPGYIAAIPASETGIPEESIGGAASDDYAITFIGEEVATIYDGKVVRMIRPLETWKKVDGKYKKQSNRLPETDETTTPLFQIIGEQGAAALDLSEESGERLRNLAKAREMEAAEKDAKTIRLATGWERGADGKWRYEVPDGQVNVEPLKELFKNAELANKEVVFDLVTYRKNEDGSYDVLMRKKGATRTTEFADYKNISKRDLYVVIDDATVVDRILKGEGNESIIGENLDEAKEILTEFTTFITGAIPITDVVDNPALFEAYPQIKDVVIAIDKALGNDAAYVTKSDGQKVIKIGHVWNRTQSSILHEVQHAIQEIEGFARGGNANLFSEARNNIHRLFKDIDAVFSKLGYDDWLMNGGVIDTTPDRNFNGMYSFAETQNKATRDKMVAKLDEANKVINENRAIFGKNNIYDNISDEELYRRLAGEAEARNVQNRMFYTPEQRREKLLAETEDVAREDQIILMADTHEPAMSESNDLTPTQQKRFDAAKAKVDAMQQAAPNALPTSVVNDVTDIADAMRQNGEKESDIAYVQQMMIKVKAARQTVTGIRTPKAVYIVVTAHKNANDVVKTWIHEQAAHHGLDLFFENKQDKERFLVRLFDALGEEQMRRLFGEKRFDSYARRNKQGEITNKSEMAEEFLAYTAEARVNNQGIWDVIKQFIRELYNNLLRKSDEFLREKARKFSRNEISLQDDDILELVNEIVTASGRQVFSPRRNRTGKSVRNTDVADVDELSRFVARIEEQELPSFLNPTIEIDGKQRPTTNSKGQPIAATEEGLRNFWRWFGDSKVVDDQGRPLVVYHGTKGDFDKFNPSVDGIHFGTAKQANMRAGGQGKNLMPVYLKIDDWQRSKDNTLYKSSWKPSIKSAKGSGRDGIVYLNRYEGITLETINRAEEEKFNIDNASDAKLRKFAPELEDSYIVFSPTQIKSATGNDGSFDPENPDIRFRVAGQPDATNDEDITPIKEGMTTNQKRVFDARRKLQDRMLGLRRLQEIITERGGKVPDWANPYNEENRSYSKTLFEQDRYNDRLFKPLIAHIAAIGKRHDLTPEEVSRYMKAKHSLERHESGTDAISDNPLDAWNMDLVNDLITDFEGKVSKQELDTLWELTNKATWAAVEKIYQSGMMTRDQYLALQERGNKEWKHYVPLRGWKYEEGESPEETFEYIPMTRAANGRTVYNKALIKARGRNSEPDDPLGYISNIAQTSIIAGNHNHIGRQFLELMRLNKGNTDLYQIKELWYVLNPNTGTWEETIDRPDQEMIDASNSAAAKVTTMQRQLNKAVEIGDIALQDTLRDQIEEESKKVVVSRQINTGHTKKIARRLSEQHEFEVMDKGLKYVVITDPIVANAMARRDKPTGMLADVMTSSSRAMGRPTRWLTQNFTAKNPDFVGPNWVRDASYAIFRNMVNDDGSALKLMAEFGGSMKANDRYLRKKIKPIWDKVNTLDWNDPATFEAVEKQYGKQALYDTLIEKFYELGGATGYVHLEEPEVIRKKAIKEMSRMMNTNSRLDKAWQSGIIQKPGKALTYFATMSENHVRFATFVMEMKMGKGWNASTDAAKNASVNFNRKGTWTASLGGLWGFFNAQIQGGHNAFSMAMRHKGRFAMAATAFAVTGAVSTQLIAMMLAAGDGGDDKHYTEYDMMNNILIPVGEGKPIKIPLPFVFRSFWALGVSSVLAAHGKKDAEDMAVSTVNSVLDIFSPFDIEPTELKEGNIPVRSFIPTAITPAYDLYMNRDFTGGRVYKEAYTPEQDQYLPDSERGLAHTNPYLVKLTQALNKLGGGDNNRPATLKLENGEVVKRDGVDAFFYEWLVDKNPAQIEHVVEYYLGGRGRFMNNVIKSAYGLATGTMPESRNMPILNRFLGANPQNSMVADYYKTTDAIKMNMHYRAELMKSGDYDNWIKLQENVNMSVAISIYSSLSPVIDMYNDQLKAATTDQERDEARKNRNDMIETFMSLYKNATKENDDE